MNSNRYERAPRFSATGVSTVAILVMIVTMVISVTVEPRNAKVSKVTASVAATYQNA
jgi:putative flippase GtrA